MESFESDTLTIHPGYYDQMYIHQLLCLNCLTPSEIFKDGEKSGVVNGFIYQDCKHCGNTYQVEIDIKLINIIIELNRKGFETEFCCHGHAQLLEDGSLKQVVIPYIQFTEEYPELKVFETDPSTVGWEYELIRKRSKKTSRYISGYKTSLYWTTDFSKYPNWDAFEKLLNQLSRP